MTVETRRVDSGTYPWSPGRALSDVGDLTFPQMIARQARECADQDLFVDGATRLSYAEFATRMTDVTRSLMALGVNRGDRVGVWAPNSAEWLVAALGASAAGATIILMNSRFRGAEAFDIVQRGRPQVLFTVRRFLNTDYPAMVREAADGDLGDLRIVVLDGAAGEGDLAWDEFLALGDSVGVDAAIDRRESISSDDVSDVILTSGTTGRPNGVMTSHRQNLLAWTRYAEHLELRRGERINATLPFFHNFGFKAGFLVSALLGGRCVCEATFDPARLARLVEAEKISFLKGTPALFVDLLASPGRHDTDLSSLRLCLVAGAMISQRLVERMQAELCPQVITGYGLSELAGAIALTPVGADATRVAQWSGRLMAGVEVRVVDEAGDEVPRGEPGEILARSDCVMLGYMDQPGVSTSTVGPDGWLRTGDIGVLDGENYIRVTDRKKDMFIVGGFNAYPAEIERLLLMHPGIRQAAVVGMPDERLGEVGAAFVVADPGADLRSQEIISWCRATMANYKVPRRVDVMAELPVNASMKVLKNELRARLSAD